MGIWERYQGKEEKITVSPEAEKQWGGIQEAPPPTAPAEYQKPFQKYTFQKLGKALTGESPFKQAFEKYAPEEAKARLSTLSETAGHIKEAATAPTKGGSIFDVAKETKQSAQRLQNPLLHSEETLRLKSSKEKELADANKIYLEEYKRQMDTADKLGGVGAKFFVRTLHETIPGFAPIEPPDISTGNKIADTLSSILGRTIGFVAGSALLEGAMPTTTARLGTKVGEAIKLVAPSKIASAAKSIASAMTKEGLDGVALSGIHSIIASDTKEEAMKRAEEYGLGNALAVGGFKLIGQLGKSLLKGVAKKTAEKMAEEVGHSIKDVPEEQAVKNIIEHYNSVEGLPKAEIKMTEKAAEKPKSALEQLLQKGEELSKKEEIPMAEKAAEAKPSAGKTVDYSKPKNIVNALENAKEFDDEALQAVIRKTKEILDDPTKYSEEFGLELTGDILDKLKLGLKTAEEDLAVRSLERIFESSKKKKEPSKLKDVKAEGDKRLAEGRLKRPDEFKTEKLKAEGFKADEPRTREPKTGEFTSQTEYKADTAPSPEIGDKMSKEDFRELRTKYSSEQRNVEILDAKNMAEDILKAKDEVNAGVKAESYLELIGSKSEIPQGATKKEIASIVEKEGTRVARANMVKSLLEDNPDLIVKGEKPEGWTKITKSGYGDYYAPSEYVAKQLAPLVDEGWYNDMLEGGGIFSKALGTFNTLKEIKLSLDLVLEVRAIAQYLGNNKLGIDGLIQLARGESFLPFTSAVSKEAEKIFVKSGGIVPAIKGKVVGGVEEAAGRELSKYNPAKYLLKVEEWHMDKVYGKLQRQLKIADFMGKRSTWIAKHPKATEAEFKTAQQAIAREVNATYKGLNYEAIGTRKSTQDIARLALLAPDYTLSKIQLLKEASEMNPAAISNILSSVVGLYGLTNAVNWITTGKPAWQNPANRRMDMAIGGGRYVTIVPDWFSDLQSMTKSGTTAFEGTKAPDWIPPKLKTPYKSAVAAANVPAKLVVSKLGFWNSVINAIESKDTTALLKFALPAPVEDFVKGITAKKKKDSSFTDSLLVFFGLIKKD